MTAADFDYVRRLVRDRSGIVLEEGKEYLVDARLTPVARQCDLGSVSDLIGRLRAGPDAGLATRVVEAMVTTETSFFRDLHPFQTLRATVLPDLIRRRRDERRLAVWFAACATGQEPYSFALLAREHFPELIGWRLDLLATDLSAEALARARAGVFTQLEVNRGLPAALLVRYFRQHGATWELTEGIRRMVEFRELNLTRPWPVLPRMDLVFLRNVMIYFDVDTKKTILARAARVLRPDGYLLLGGAETTLNLNESIRRVEQLKGGFYQLVA
ncbi:MAG TPA: protein-glutamate O-methyltransferase CheR [Gemmataceae bacterium]|nr:protein-glutamate O-methyltransferase CheR [Gemmataceae bacterium]